MDPMLAEAMQVAVEAAHAAGQVLCDMLETASVREKAPKDLVTDADVAAQNEIQQRIAAVFPTHSFLGEESSDQPVTPATAHVEPWRWVVDPLDGTVNFVHRLPNFAVSIALMNRDTTVLGVVFDPMAKEMYAATLGGGATINGKPLRSSLCTKLNAALVAASFPPNIQRGSVEVEQFIEILIQSQSVRRLGSAALNLCYVGHGRLDGYWASCLKVWDVAAGALIADEAGAVLRKQNGDIFDPWLDELIATSTQELHGELRDCLDSVRVHFSNQAGILRKTT